jgi:hypothetical protein
MTAKQKVIGFLSAIFVVILLVGGLVVFAGSRGNDVPIAQKVNPSPFGPPPSQ